VVWGLDGFIEEQEPMKGTDFERSLRQANCCELCEAAGAAAAPRLMTLLVSADSKAASTYGLRMASGFAFVPIRAVMPRHRLVVGPTCAIAEKDASVRSGKHSALTDLLKRS
jgi:hypothetical protein